jgi:hypothetical protein
MHADTYVWKCPGGALCKPWYLVATVRPKENKEMRFEFYDNDGKLSPAERVGKFSHFSKGPFYGYFDSEKELKEGLLKLGVDQEDVQKIETGQF